MVTDDLNPKIIDFGLAKSKFDLNKGNNCYAATPNYAAPEIFKQQKLTAKIDIYAFGVLMWEIKTEQVPLDGMSFQTIKEKISKGYKYNFNQIESSYADIIRSCLEKNPENRPTFAEIRESLEALSN